MSFGDDTLDPENQNAIKEKNELEFCKRRYRDAEKRMLKLEIIRENSEIQLMRMHKIIELERQARQIMEDSLKDQIETLQQKVKDMKIHIPDQPE